MKEYKITEDTIKEFTEYFDILQKHSELAQKNKGMDVEGLEKDLNDNFEKLSKKYNEDFLWYTMKQARNERVFFVASGVIYRKHNLVVKVVRQNDADILMSFVESEIDVNGPY